MSKTDPRRFHRWGAVSIAMLVLGLLILVPSGLCVGEAVNDLYLRPTPLRGFGATEATVELIGGMVVLAFGLSVIFLAFRSRTKPDDE